MTQKSFCVYRHTSPIGKVYIGITCQNPYKRWQNGRGYLDSHNQHFYNAILRYGWDAFKHEILLDGLTKSEAEAAEIRLISEHRATDPNYGYNRSNGGEHHGRDTTETRRKKSEAKIGEKNPMFGRHVFLGTPCDVSGANHPMYGRRGPDNPRYGMRHSTETIAKMRENNVRNRAVRCVETGETYPSAQAAGRAVGISGNGIAGCCRNKPHYNTAGGYHWRWSDDG